MKSLCVFLLMAAPALAAPCLSPYPSPKVIYNDQIIFTDQDNHMVVCSLRTRKKLRQFKRPAGPIDSLAAEKSGNYVLASGYGNHIKLFHLPSQSVAKVIDRDTWNPVKIAGSSKAKDFFVTNGARLLVYDRNDGKKKATYRWHQRNIEGIFISPSDKYLLSSDSHETLVWQKQNMRHKPRRLALGHTSVATFTGNDKTVYIANRERQKSFVYQVDVTSLEKKKVFENDGLISQMHIDEVNQQLVMRIRRNFFFLSLVDGLKTEERLSIKSYRNYKIGQAHFWPIENALVSFEIGTGELKIWQIRKGFFSPRAERQSTKASGGNLN